MTPLDRTRLTEALALAEAGYGRTEPNPRVGCIVGLADGTVFGRGSTQQAGGPHAEVMALRDAAAAGHEVRGATAWVTLEPCAHHGRTPPCTDAIVAAGLARVVVALRDPFPQVAGAGLARLREAGIDVVVAGDGAYDGVRDGAHDGAHDGGAAGAAASDDAAAAGASASAADAASASAIADAARDVNIGFLSRVVRGRPWLRLKVAASLDGRTALPDGTSQWITGAAARADGHAWRRRASAVLTGIGTVLDDDPRLDVREVPTVLQPLRVVVDSRFETPPHARLLDPPGRGVWIFGAVADAARQAALRERGAETLLAPGPGGKVDLAAMLDELARRGVNELHVEAGHKLNGSLLRAGLVDELLVYLAPRLIGAGREMAVFGPLASLAETLDYRWVDVARVGDDLRLRLRPPGRERF